MHYWRLVSARSIVVAAALLWLLPIDSAAQPAVANVTAVEMSIR